MSFLPFFCLLFCQQVTVVLCCQVRSTSSSFLVEVLYKCAVTMMYQYICTYMHVFMHTCRYYMAHRNQNLSLNLSAALETISSVFVGSLLEFLVPVYKCSITGCVTRDLFWKVECFCFSQIRWWFARSVCSLFVVSHRSASGWFGWATETGTGQNH